MEEKESDYEEYLLESEPIEVKKSKCCLCCCGEDKEKSKSYYINKWRKYLSIESENVSHPFRILTHLWAHKNVIKDLENIRLNPNLMSEKNIRNDLEFYIPQLCTFLIFGDYEAVEEFLAFLCKACYASFFFAHRVVWFLKSLINNSNMNEKIEYILQLIQTIFKSEKDKFKLERLHIANSKKYTDLMNKYNLSFLFNKCREEIDEGSLNSLQSEYYNIYKTSFNLIQTFCDRHFEYANELEKFDRKLISELEDFKWKFYLNPEEVFINIFKNGNYNNSSDLTSNNDINFQSFLGSVNFIDKLTDICENMKDVLIEDQMGYLIKHMYEINKTLPSNIYTPFLKDSVRNYLIVHIPVTEIKIFRTKNRAPYMITVEVIRIEEIINKMLKKEKSKTQNLKERRESNGIYLDPQYSVNNNKIRSYSMATSNPDHQNDNNLYLVNPHLDLSLGNNLEKRKLNAKSLLDVKMNENSRKRSSTLRMLDESNIRLSKPVTISNLEAEIKRAPLRGEKKIILEEKEEYEESFIKEDMEELVKRRLTVYPMSNKNKSKNLLEENEKNEEINFKNKSSNFNLNGNNQEDSNFKFRNRTNTSVEPMKKSKIFDDEITIKTKNTIIDETIIDNEIEKETSKSDKEDLRSSVRIDFKNIFGELIEDQTIRLKNQSPFGQFNTWKLFKFIIKSGEDLRQEQFATQLINEFQQIFQIEKVGCWVNTYEILATGNNVGIIECVPNAISIDTLKKKIKNNSLRTFFENYFGPVESTCKQLLIKFRF